MASIRLHRGKFGHVSILSVASDLVTTRTRSPCHHMAAIRSDDRRRCRRAYLVQRAFLEGFAAQCSFYTPGMLVAAESLSDRTPIRPATRWKRFPAEDSLQLLGENPDTAFILTHCGMLTGSDGGTVEAWKQGLKTFAKEPNLYAKLSPLGTFEHRNDADLIASICAAAIAILGSEA